MTSPVQINRASVILLDIEGTTTPVDFVYTILFPFAREHTRRFIAEHLSDPDVLIDLAGLANQCEADRREGLDPPGFPESVTSDTIDQAVSYIHWLMDADRKVTPLKSLQGKIWEEGYRTGILRGQVFGDVAAAFQRWSEQKKRVAIFSSGSVLAQKLLFSNTTEGDLTRFIEDYFDTNIGAKSDARTYVRIAERLKSETGDILFLSDMPAELTAAKSAGMQAVLCVRPGNQQQEASGWPVITSFDELS